MVLKKKLKSRLYAIYFNFLIYNLTKQINFDTKVS